jgi:hypothetical protein
MGLWGVTVRQVPNVREWLKFTTVLFSSKNFFCRAEPMGGMVVEKLCSWGLAILICFDLEETVVGVDVRNVHGDETLAVTGGGRIILELVDLVGFWEVFLALVAHFPLLPLLAPKGVVMIEALVVRRVHFVIPFLASGSGALKPVLGLSRSGCLVGHFLDGELPRFVEGCMLGDSALVEGRSEIVNGLVVVHDPFVDVLCRGFLAIGLLASVGRTSGLRGFYCGAIHDGFRGPARAMISCDWEVLK